MAKRKNKALGDVQENAPEKITAAAAAPQGMPVWGVMLLCVAVGITGFVTGKVMTTNAALPPGTEPAIKGGGSIPEMRTYLINFFLENAALTDAQKLKAAGNVQALTDDELKYAHEFVYNWVAKGQTPASNSPLLSKVKMLNTKYGIFLALA